MRSANQAVAAARAQVTNPTAPAPRRWRGLCLAFVRTCWGIPSTGIPSANAAWTRATQKVTSGTPPKGAPVYWGGGTYGHIAISAGGGRVYSNDIRRTGRIDLVPISEIHNHWGSTYRGWSRDYAGIPLPLAGTAPAEPEEDIVASLADLKKVLADERKQIASAVLHTEIAIPPATAKAHGYTRPSRRYKFFELVVDSWRVRDLQAKVAALSRITVPKATRERWHYGQETYETKSIILDASWKTRACEERLRSLAAAFTELVALLEPAKQDAARKALARAMASPDDGEPATPAQGGNLVPAEVLDAEVVVDR